MKGLHCGNIVQSLCKNRLGLLFKLRQHKRLDAVSHFIFHHKKQKNKTSHKKRPTESSGGLWILIHSTEGPFTCRNLWKRFLNPSKAFLDTWKTHGFYLYLYSFYKKKGEVMWRMHKVPVTYINTAQQTMERWAFPQMLLYSAVQGKLLGSRWGFSCCLKAKILCAYDKSQKIQEWAERSVKCTRGYLDTDTTIYG